MNCTGTVCPDNWGARRGPGRFPGCPLGSAGAPGILWGLLVVPVRSLRGSLGVPGGPWGSLEGPWRISAGSWGVVGNAWGVPGRSLGVPGGFYGASVGDPRWALKNVDFQSSQDGRCGFPSCVIPPPGPPGTRGPPRPARDFPGPPGPAKRNSRAPSIVSQRDASLFASLSLRIASLSFRFASLSLRFALASPHLAF